MNQGVAINGAGSYRKRPGPFGPAWALLPKDQQPLAIDGDVPVHDAIERMIDNNFSQLPVKDGQGRIIGVFTWKSFGKRALDLQNVRGGIKPIELPVREAMEPARFIDPEVYIDTETDWGDIDHVLVGSDDDLRGVLCIADVFGRLNDFAEAFVLLYEIEHEIRDLIRDLVDSTGLATMIAAMHLPPGSTAPVTLEEFTFNQYKGLISARANWPTFEPLFATRRELVDADFGDVNELRNVVFHFRRGITPKDTDRLRRFRDKLRYNRELFARQRAPAVLAT
ncbi:MAG TPA: CBS domain-containing protein [Pirellulales bacterium]|nr:CBS domain-containing protein [Pirellulales bacterium]